MIVTSKMSLFIVKHPRLKINKFMVFFGVDKEIGVRFEKLLHQGSWGVDFILKVYFF